ncbi:hypothetical protein, partial [Salmonella sp. s60131]|uniref:hypothetical protein n=1 Tax=Salmonella sp. s60131 TaxID=3159722 RepID=UPI00397F4899
MQDWKAPKNATEVRSFLPKIHKGFCENLSSTHKADKEESSFQLGLGLRVCFPTLEKGSYNSPSSYIARWKQDFTVYTDASGMGLGAVLM